MEYVSKSYESEDKPEKPGNLEASKKKRKKTRVPLKKAVKKEADKSQDTAEKPETKSISEILEETKKEQDQSDKSKDSLELPEISEGTIEIAHDSEFEGELVVEHNESQSEKKDQTIGIEAREFETLEEPNEHEGQPVVIDNKPELITEDKSEKNKESEETPDVAPPKVAPPLIFNFPPETALKAKPEIKPEAPVEKSISPVAIPIRKIKEILNSKKAEKTATSPSETITEAEVRDREYRAEKRGLSRGVVSGGVAGWLLGRRGRSKMEREIKNSVNRRKQAEKDLDQNMRNADQVENRYKNIIKRTEEELNKLKQRSWDKHVLKRTEFEIPVAPPSRISETVKPVYGSASPVLKTEKPKFETIRKNNETVSKNKEIQNQETLKLPKVPSEYKEIKEDDFKAPEGRRFETSAWHRIEVDEKTGKAVEKPSVEYGEAFKKEQQQERLAKQAAKAQTAAQVGMTVISSGTEESKDPLVPKNLAKSPSVSLITKDEFNKEAAAVIRQVVKNTSSPATWIAAFVIVILLLLTDIL